MVGKIFTDPGQFEWEFRYDPPFTIKKEHAVIKACEMFALLLHVC